VVRAGVDTLIVASATADVTHPIGHTLSLVRSQVAVAPGVWLVLAVGVVTHPVVVNIIGRIIRTNVDIPTHVILVIVIGRVVFTRVDIATDAIPINIVFSVIRTILTIATHKVTVRVILSVTGAAVV